VSHVTQNELPFSPAAHRNAAAIFDVLSGVLPGTAKVLEIASGTGQHAAHFAAARTGWDWQPTDAEEAALPGIAKRCEALPNVHPALRLDVLAPWPASLGRFDALYCANMLHISPWATCRALMRGAAAHLVDHGRLLIYGPFVVDEEPTAPSNLAFDADLRARDADWGIRRLLDVVDEARSAGMSLERRIGMPANNLLLIFGRES
jgi:SAM-dependent methyltransferase